MTIYVIQYFPPRRSASASCPEWRFRPTSTWAIDHRDPPSKKLHINKYKYKHIVCKSIYIIIDSYLNHHFAFYSNGFTERHNCFKLGKTQPRISQNASSMDYIQSSTFNISTSLNSIYNLEMFMFKLFVFQL